MTFDMSIFRQTVKKIQVLLRFDDNNEHFTWRPTNIYDNILPNSSENEKMLRRKSYRENKNTHFMFNDSVYEIMLQNMVEP